MSTDDTLQALKDQLAMLSKQMEEAEEVLKPIADEEQKIASIEYQIKQDFEAQMRKIREDKQRIAQEKYSKQVAVSQLKGEAAAINAKVQQVEQEAAAKKAAEEKAALEAKQYDALGKRFDTATIGAPWREWAKDHQISAGHKLVQDRYVILADPMGLGKTLSSIITADMAEKVTKEAKPDEPFLGQVEQVFIQPHFVWTKKAEIAAIKNEWPFTVGFFSESFKHEPSATPWDDPIITFRNKPIAAGEKYPGFFPAFDLKQKIINEGYIERVEGHYEQQVVNAVERPVGRKILYFCPSALLRNVMEEWRRWAPHRNVTYIGNMSKAERNFVLDLTLPKLNEYVIIINYEAWRRDKALLNKLIECKFDTIIIDEAHNVKDMKSIAYKGVKQVIDETKPEYVIPMTGTPVLNRPQELFSILTLVNPKEFYNERDFLFRYCEEYYPLDMDGNPSNNPKWKFKEGGLDQLAKRISKNFLRRTKDQAGVILPDKTVIYHELDLDTDAYPMQSKARTHMKKFATLVLDQNSGKALQATVMIALITRLRQIETWPAGIKQIDKTTKETILELGQEFAESQKMDYIINFDSSTDEWEGLIPGIIEDERIVVFSQFKAPLHELEKRINAMGYKAVVFDGDTPQNIRDDIRHDFDRNITPDRSKAKYDVLLANYKAAGVGLNLTAATQMVILDEEWNSGKRDQAFDRIHRIGQTQNVTINVVRTKNTIDTWLAGLISDKEKIVDGFEGAMMNANDLKEALDSGLI